MIRNDVEGSTINSGRSAKTRIQILAYPSKCVALAALTGILLQATFPPASMWYLIFTAFVPGCMAVQNQRYLARLLLGFIVGIIAYADFSWSFAGWGFNLQFWPPVVCATLIAVQFSLALFYEERLPSRWQWLGLPCAWLIVSGIGEYVFHVPLSLAFSLGIEVPKLLWFASIIGGAGVDFLLVACSTLTYSLLQRKIAITIGFACISLIVLTLLFGLLVGDPDNIMEDVKTVNVHAIQGNVSKADYQSAQWSIHARRKIESRFDDLTHVALLNGPSLIVWPEGGNNLYNLKLPRRKVAFQGYLDSQHELIFTGKDIGASGERYNSAHFVTAKGEVQSANKSFIVPFAESGLEPGKPTVFHTDYGNVGIAICFDSLFREHYSSLVQKGAQWVFVTSDDSSFGTAYMADWHLAYSVLRSIEIGRPLLFLSNAGPVASFIPGEGFSHLSGRSDSHGIYGLSVGIKNGASPYTSGFCYVPFVVLSVTTFIALFRRSKQVEEIGSNRLMSSSILPLFLLALLALLFGQIVYLLAASVVRESSIREFIQSAAERHRGTLAVDGITYAYRQSTNNTCGAAAVSFLLTFMGDEVFEQDVMALIPEGIESGYSMLQLAKFARSRGFSARGYMGDVSELPKTGGQPLIAHMKEGHYVVVMFTDSSDVTFMDPAHGRIMKKSRQQFSKEWSGYMLVIDFA